MIIRQFIIASLLFCMQTLYGAMSNPEVATSMPPLDQVPQQASSLSTEQMNEILKKHQATIDKASNANTQTYVTKAATLAERYTSPAFLDPILNPEKARSERQKSFNNQLFFTLETPPLFNLPPTIGIYNGDLVRAGTIGAAWGLEWWFYQALQEALTAALVDHVISHAAEVAAVLNTSVAVTKLTATTPPTKPILTWPTIGYIIPTLNKKLCGLLITYAIGSVVLQWARNRYQVTTPPTPTADQPVSISTLVPFRITEIITAYGNPQSWISSLNRFFKSMHLLPDWVDRTEVLIIQEFLVALFWLGWHINNVLIQRVGQALIEHANNVAPALDLIAHLEQKKLQQALTPDEQQQYEAAKAILHALVQPSMRLPFTTWIAFKSLQTSLWYSVTSLILSTPAWYKIARWAYTTYNAVNCHSGQGPGIHQ